MRLSLLNLLEDSVSPALTFGLEIEIFMGEGHSSGKSEDVVFSQRMVERFLSLPLKLDWGADVDGTCMPGIEIKSPVMSAGSVGERERSLSAIVRDLGVIGKGFTIYHFNPRDCGTHIHVGGVSEETKGRFTELWVANLQQYLKFFMGAERYEKMVGGYSLIKPVNSAADFFYFGASGQITGARKFLNVRLHDEFGTIEFRALDATLDGDRISYLVNLALNVVGKTDRLFELLQRRVLGGRVLAREVLPRLGRRSVVGV